ncbi:hypothetical protein BHE74_00042700 [Ensete ventricosum]|nr:hypothetical protein GW17_00010753 [Ensete ventricosum]RWW50991.1 hypothetical protein BHE74_00042700 [Ensete ventricosum]RZS16761.1 hypothetical protein BHM03_00048798 [Ensete ventricosum]
MILLLVAYKFVHGYLVRFAGEVPPLLASPIDDSSSLQLQPIGPVEHEPLPSVVVLRPLVWAVGWHDCSINLDIELALTSASALDTTRGKMRAHLKRELTVTRAYEHGRQDLESVALRDKNGSRPVLAGNIPRGLECFGVIGDSIAYCSEGSHVEHRNGVRGIAGRRPCVDRRRKGRWRGNGSARTSRARRIPTIACTDRLRRRRVCASGVCRIPTTTCTSGVGGVPTIAWVDGLRCKSRRKTNGVCRNYSLRWRFHHWRPSNAVMESSMNGSTTEARANEDEQ